MKTYSTAHRWQTSRNAILLSAYRLRRERRLGAGLRRIAGFLLFNFNLLIFHSCEKPVILLNQPNEDIRSVGGFISNNFDYTLFTAALEYTGLMDTITNSPGPFTLFAPTNTAFIQLGITHPSDFLHMDRDSLREAMAYHIVTSRIMEQDIPQNVADTRYGTLAQRDQYISRAMEGTTSHLYVSGAYVQSKDIVLSNGILHSPVKVLKSYPITVQEWLSTHPQYSTFVAGLRHFGLWDELADPGPFTVFAPENDVFELHGITAETIDAMDVSQYIGARLFGAYIMYGKHYFVLDWDFFYRTEGQFFLVNSVRDDTYNQVFMGVKLYGDFLQTRDDRLYYSLGITQLNIPYGFAFQASRQVYGEYYGIYYDGFDEDHFLGSGTAGEPANYIGNYGLTRAKFDHVCDNGLIHDLNALLVMPEEAER